MDGKRIKTITLYFPNTEFADFIRYEVGKNEITKIEHNLFYPAEFCTKVFYRIYRNDRIIADMYDYSLIEYFED